MNLAHHYTTTLRLPFIVADKRLRPGNDRLLWFTQDRSAGRVSPPLPDDAAREGFPVRFACPACLLMPWRRVARTVGWSDARIETEGQRAIERQINPNEWLAATQPLELSRLTVQILTPDRGWWPVDAGDLQAKRYVMFALPRTGVLRAGPLVRLYRRRKLTITVCCMRYQDGQDRLVRLQNRVQSMGRPI